LVPSGWEAEVHHPKNLGGLAMIALMILPMILPAAARAQSSADAFNPGANGRVKTFVVQPDGKILVGGEFTSLGGGGTGSAGHHYIGRLNADGSLDANFNCGASANVNTIALQHDGGILVGGDFRMLGGGSTGTSTRNYLGRLRDDGGLDSSFDTGANGNVWSIVVQSDGKILVGGEFTALGGGFGTSVRNHIGRLNPDGTVDTSFDPGANGPVTAIAVQADGKIVVGGRFSTLGGGGIGTSSRNYIGRLNPDGSLDTEFNPGASYYVNAIVVQPDQKILLGGGFTSLGGGGFVNTTTRYYIGRLNLDGSVDMGFNPGAYSTVYALALQADGKIILGGSFITLGGGGRGTVVRNWIGRLYTDGSVDMGFSPGANYSVRAIVVQPDGRILVGGEFTRLGGAGYGTSERNYIGRLNAESMLQRAAFKADFDGDHKIDLLWHNSATGQVYIWLMNGANPSAIASPGTMSDPGWQIQALADFNRDSRTDVLWRQTSTGQLCIWLMNGTSIQAAGIPGVVGDMSWLIVCAADFNGDGKADILWRHGVTGQLFIWLMNGVDVIAVQSPGGVSDLAWRIERVGDLNGDGKDDLLWRHAGSGQLYVWIMNGTQVTSLHCPGAVADLDWQIEALFDFNGDGKADIFWRHYLTGQLYIWLMDGMDPASMGCPGGVADQNWGIQSAADLNGDGKTDFLWRHRLTGQVYVWLMNGVNASATGSPGTMDDLRWQVMGLGDLNGDGAADLFWHNDETGQTYVWLMNGIAATLASSPGTVSDRNWKIWR
jgi:uncharacterized delta-60 repeat protein